MNQHNQTSADVMLFLFWLYFLWFLIFGRFCPVGGTIFAIGFNYYNYKKNYWRGFDFLFLRQLKNFLTKLDISGDITPVLEDTMKDIKEIEDTLKVYRV